MRLLINTSTLKGTGVSQVAISFINECRNFKENLYVVILSKSVAKGLKKETFPSNFVFEILNDFSFHPFSLVSNIKRLSDLENEYRPDCVFSVFGPSYWTPTTPHLMGYAYPHYIYKDSPFFNAVSMRYRGRLWVKEKFHSFFLRRNGQYYVAETKDVAQRLSRFLGISMERVFVVNNTCNHFFLDQHDFEKRLLPKKRDSEFRFLSLSTPYPHKNLQILNLIIPLINERNLPFDVKFVVTVPDVDFMNLFEESVVDRIINLGVLDVFDCPIAYLETDALFHPTLLECFSASYVEAMEMKRPILTSDLPFSRGICENAAIYFNAEDPNDVVDKISELLNTPSLYNDLVRRGTMRKATFPSAVRRAESYLEICKLISS